MSLLRGLPSAGRSDGSCSHHEPKDGDLLCECGVRHIVFYCYDLKQSYCWGPCHAVALRARSGSLVPIEDSSTEPCTSEETRDMPNLRQIQRRDGVVRTIRKGP